MTDAKGAEGEVMVAGCVEKPPQVGFEGAEDRNIQRQVNMPNVGRYRDGNTPGTFEPNEDVGFYVAF